MATGGYLEWDRRVLVDYPYLDGRTLVGGFPEITWEESEGLMVLKMYDGSHRTQTLYVGDKAPTLKSAFTFNFSMLYDDEEDYFRVVRAARRGAVVWWCPYLWTEEVFNVTNGNTYTLSRPIASSVVPGVTAVTHPTTFYLDDTLDGGAASVTSQTVTAADTGELAVRYMPVFRVILANPQRFEVPETGALLGSVQLIECVSGDFG